MRDPQHLAVSGGTDVHVTYVDDYGTVCANAGASSTVGDTWVWTYDPDTNTLFDGVVTWYRP